jgi:transposase
MAVGRGIPGLDGAMRGLLAARDAILKAIVAIDADMKTLERSSAACRRLMTIPGVGRLTVLAFAAAIDDPGRFSAAGD